MTGPEDGRPLGGRGVTFAVAAIAMAVFGLVGGLPALLGPIVGVVGLAASDLWRRRPPTGATFGPLPVLLGLSAIAVSSPAVPSTELFGGFATVAVLLWLADDPGRPAGGGRRAVLALGSCALAVVVAGAVVLGTHVPHREVGVAGGVLAFVLLLLSYLLVREAGERRRGVAQPLSGGEG